MRSSICLALIAALGMLPTAMHADPVRLPNGAKLTVVDFERHVASLLSKQGCNAGACHGSFQGKGGFRLSLFGHDPEQDFDVLTRAAMGRRINTSEPDKSLLLLKATGQVSHGGGKRFDKTAWQYDVIRAWIAQGARRQAGTGIVSALRIEPNEHVFQRPGHSAALTVFAQYADGTSADVTPFCDFRSKDDSIADVSPLGLLRSLAPGDAPIIVSYRGNLAAARVLTPLTVRAGDIYPAVPERNFIDREVFAKLGRLNIVPSDVAGDAEFLRRVTIDTIGSLPTPDEARRFLQSSDPSKRERKIDELLAHPLHAALWATKFCDITSCNVDVMDGPTELRGRRAKMWHDWFRTRFAQNVGYDQIVRGVLAATSREGKDIESWIDDEAGFDRAARQSSETGYANRPTLDLFWRRTMGEEFFPPEQMAELTATAFMGVRIECAQCHKHPFDRWTQTDYRAFANLFSQVQFGSSPELTAAVSDRLEARRRLPPGKAGPPIPRLREVYVTDHRPRRLPAPDSDELLPARALGGPAIGGEADMRDALYRWLVAEDNPHFARSFVNRVWAHYFGIGLVEPVDSFSVANPPSNEILLDALAKEFAASGYDIRRLEQAILRSRTYQLSSLPNATNKRDRTNYSHSQARPMMAEAVVDVLNAAFGTSEDFGSDAPAGTHAIEIASNRVRNLYVARIFRVFGRPARTTTCDCERPNASAVPQTLFLMSDPVLLQKAVNGRLKSLLASKRTNSEVIDELFLSTLSRFPDAAEKRDALEHVATAARRDAGFMDIVWALINTREFILNH